MTISKSESSGATLNKGSNPKNLIKFHYLKKTLLVGMNNPSKFEKEEFKMGDIVFKLIDNSNHLILLFKIGALDWSDIAYSFFLDMKNDDKNYEEILKKSLPHQFNLILFDTDSRNILIKRIISFNIDFAEKMRDLVIDQMFNPFSFEEYKKYVKKIYRTYSSEELALSKLVSATNKIMGESKEKEIEVVYDRFGFGTNKPIPLWAYQEIHHPKIYGVITKESIPKNLLRKGVSRCTYKKIKGKHWKVIVYKTKKVKKTRR